MIPLACRKCHEKLWESFSEKKVKQQSPISSDRYYDELGAVREKESFGLALPFPRMIFCSSFIRFSSRRFNLRFSSSIFIWSSIIFKRSSACNANERKISTPIKSIGQWFSTRVRRAGDRGGTKLLQYVLSKGAANKKRLGNTLLGSHPDSPRQTVKGDHKY